MRITSLLLVLLIALAGCGGEEEFVGVDPVADPDPQPPQSNQLYLKGPTELRTGNSAQFRAEPLPGTNLEIYSWGVYGDGEVSTTFVDPEGYDRIVSALATQEGLVTLYFRAYDVDGNQLGYGEKTVRITEY